MKNEQKQTTNIFKIMVNKAINKHYETPVLTESRVVAARSILTGSADGTFEGVPASAQGVTTYNVGSTTEWF